MTSNPEETPRPAIERARQLTIDALCEHFANDVIAVEEFERRIDSAHGAASAEELARLLSDLPGGELPAVSQSATPPALADERRIAPAGDVPERSYAVALLGGTRRGGRWIPARTNVAIAIMGGAELDFREAMMGPGVTELSVFALWGGVEVIVPPGMNVESHGIGLLGGFEHTAEGTPDPRAPTLRITGVALMGGVDISVRHAGESARDARRRRRQQRRERARELRGGITDPGKRLKP